MFEETNKSEETAGSPPERTEEKTKTAGFKTEKEIVSGGEIHTIPVRFHEGSEKKGGQKSKLTMIGLVILGILFLGGVAAFLFSKIIKKSPPETSNLNAVSVTNENINQVNQNLNQNLNLNGNLNQNIDVNQNLNLNVEANENLNGNINVNANANSNVNLNTNMVMTTSIDSDQDGLTDKEEDVYGTNPKKPDSDSDGYADGVELASNYDPLGSGKLTSSTAVKIYTNDDYAYTILYPKSWFSQATNQNDKAEVLFTADTAEFVEVLAQDNPSSLTAEQWFLTQFPELTSGNLSKITTWDGEEGIMGLDAANVYLATDDYIYIVTYNTGTKKEANFRETFEMMYQSFKVVPASETNANVNINTNTNANTNQNQNLNQNSNINSNTNSNSNLNQNQNSNLNSNSNLNLNSNSN